MQTTIIDDLDALLDILPLHISEPLRLRGDCRELLEVVMDLGRSPEARFPHQEVILNSQEVTQQEIESVVSCAGIFSSDNRAGIERTLHRISAIRNRQGRIVGLTCRVGRAVFGSMKLIEDIVRSGKSILLLGRPGIGKTTMLREVARVLADDVKKRVIIVDTSNEIAGDGDIPHPAIGRARRMQVPTPAMQHAVMIEAVENHMPEAIIIDEIGTELEAQAARTIAERGVQLVGTAHGNTLDNLILNPTLSDLIGGIQTVTLGDEEARQRGTQKSILERKRPPTFDVVVEIQDFNKVAIHPEVGEVVDATLRGYPIMPEVRWLDEDGEVQRERAIPSSLAKVRRGQESVNEDKPPRLYLFGINRAKLEQAAKEMQLLLSIAAELKEADIFLTLKSYYRRKPQQVRDAESAGLPIYVLKSNATSEIKQFLDSIYANTERVNALKIALERVGETTTGVNEEKGVELRPQGAYIRRLQRLIADRYRLPLHTLEKEFWRRGRGSL
jgi:stage III sporulation protein SpoIIIAA